MCKELFGKEHPTRDDIVIFWYGERSLLWHVFRDRLEWTHQKFLLFMVTNSRLSTCRCSARELYSDNSPFDTDGIVERDEFTQCWDQICNVGRPSSTSAGANADTTRHR